MNIDTQAFSALIAREGVCDLVMLYARGIDRKDIELLRTLYAKGADDHGKHFNGDAGYLRFLEKSLSHMPYSGHRFSNYLVSVDGDSGEGEAYASSPII